MSLESKLLDVIDRLITIIERLISNCSKPRATALRAIYQSQKGHIELTQTQFPFMAQTITVLPAQNTVPGQLVPVASDLITIEPITTINAASEVYTLIDQATGTTSTVATVTALPSPEGAFLVSRILGQSGTVVLNYTAITPAGLTITNVGGIGDTFIFQGQPTGVAAALTATFGTAA